MERPPQDVPLHLIERAIVFAYFAVHGALPALIPLAGLAAVLGWRPGAYVVAVGLLATFLTRDLLIGMTYRREDAFATLPRLARIGFSVGFVSLLVAYVCAAAALGSSAAGWAALVALVGRLAGDVVAGIASYQDVFSRPWPVVQPVVDDDEWDW